MICEKVLEEYSQLMEQLYKSLIGLKELMGSEDYREFLELRERFEGEDLQEVEMMYKDFPSLVKDLALPYL
jgi:hypothetical protein